jgi:large subunit ribosomal protein L28
MFGNHVAHSERKVRRTWMPNIQVHRYTSDLLGREIKLNLSTEAMRNIDKCGGFDRYMLQTREIFFGGPRSFGSNLKKQIQHAYDQKQKAIQLMQREEQAALRLQKAIDRATQLAIKQFPPEPAAAV